MPACTTVGNGVAPSQQVRRAAHVLREQNGPHRRQFLPVSVTRKLEELRPCSAFCSQLVPHIFTPLRPPTAHRPRRTSFHITIIHLQLRGHDQVDARLDSVRGAAPDWLRRKLPRGD